MFVLLPFVAILMVLGTLFLQGITTLTEVLRYAIVACVLVATAYYVRRINSLKVWRVMWILLGACGIGTLALVVLLGVFGKILVLHLGPEPVLLLSFGVPIVLGALLGDYIGKRRGYQPLG